jgi:hypothetical protein
MPRLMRGRVYESAARHGGIGAVPLNQHGHHAGSRDHDGVPLCARGLRMIPSFQFSHPSGYRAQRFLCPLLFPQATGVTCDQEQFLKGKGWKKDPNWELGGRKPRHLRSRRSALPRHLHAAHRARERINSQAKELGIEHPKVHNGRSVANLNTLMYLVSNVRALQRAKSINAGLLSFPRRIR